MTVPTLLTDGDAVAPGDDTVRIREAVVAATARVRVEAVREAAREVAAGVATIAGVIGTAIVEVAAAHVVAHDVIVEVAHVAVQEVVQEVVHVLEVGLGVGLGAAHVAVLLHDILLKLLSKRQLNCLCRLPNHLLIRIQYLLVPVRLKIWKRSRQQMELPEKLIMLLTRQLRKKTISG